MTDENQTDDAPDESSEVVDTAQITDSAPGRRWLLEGIALLVVIALGTALFLVHRTDGDRSADDKVARDAVSTAEKQVLDLTTLDHTKIESQLDAMRARTVGDFKRQFDGIVQTFVQVVQKDKITATGKITAAAISEQSKSKAVVIVASSAEVTSVSSKQTSTRTYRFAVTLERVSGKWLVAGMEFVA